MKAVALAGAGDNVVHLRTRSPVQGLHVLGEWYGCPRNDAVKRAERLKTACVQLARETGFDVISSSFQQFEPDGVVGTILFTDGHLAIHTWPETGFVSIDLYACHLTPATRAKVLDLLARVREVLRPVWVNMAELCRGLPDEASA